MRGRRLERLSRSRPAPVARGTLRRVQLATVLLLAALGSATWGERADAKTRVGGIDLAAAAGSWGSWLASPGTHRGIDCTYGETASDPSRQYNGRVFDPGTGFHDYGARMYWPQIGRFISADFAVPELARPSTLNRYTYVHDNPYKYVDPTGLSGVLTIYASGNGGSSMMSGHAWIAYTPDVPGGVGATTTYGTWGNQEPNGPNGLRRDLEQGRPADSSRTMHIDDKAEAQLMSAIAKAEREGEKAWKLSKPCSGFAREAWKAGTDEDLNANYGPISNPTTLKESIVKANGGAAHAVAGKANSPSSASSGSSGRSSGSSLDSSGSLIGK